MKHSKRALLGKALDENIAFWLGSIGLFKFVPLSASNLIQFSIGQFHACLLCYCFSMQKWHPPLSPKTIVKIVYHRSRVLAL